MEDRSNRTRLTSSVVDLGDDLLEKTRVFPVEPESSEPGAHSSLRSASQSSTPASTPVSTPPSLTLPPAGSLEPHQISDLIQSAQILESEGFLEDAKKVLRRIILADASHVLARKKLEEIHEKELEQIFADSAPRRDYVRAREPEVLPRVDGDALMRSLDRDLALGVFADGPAGEAAALERLIFGSSENMEIFAKSLESELESSTARDRMDLGVAFFEMELFDLAARQFESASRDPELSASALTLLASALIFSGRAFEAGLALEPLIGDPDVPREEKLEPMYLLARANECLGKPETALNWYRLVREVDPHYRDCDDRVRLILGDKYGNH